MTWFLAFAAAVLVLLVSIVGATLLGYGTRMGLWISRHALRFLPSDQRDRYREEWEADVLSIAKGTLSDKGTSGDHHLAAFFWGLGTVHTALRRSKAGRRIPAWLLTDQSDRSILGLTSGLSIGLITGLSIALTSGMTSGLIFGLIFGLSIALTSRLIFGMIIALTSALIIELILELSIAWPSRGFGLILGLTSGLIWKFGPQLLNRIRSRFTPPQN